MRISLTPVQRLRIFVAILCVAVLLAAAWNSPSLGLLCAILTPTGAWIGFVLKKAAVRRRTRAGYPQLISLVSVLSTRAPPVASFA